MEKNQLTFEDKINLVRQDLKKLIESKKELSKQKQNTLMEMKESIEEARKADFGYLKISKFFQSHGIEITKNDLALFCKDVLGEVIPERKSKKKKDKQNLSPTSNTKKISESNH